MTLAKSTILRAASNIGSFAQYEKYIHIYTSEDLVTSCFFQRVCFPLRGGGLPLLFTSRGQRENPAFLKSSIKSAALYH